MLCCNNPLLVKCEDAHSHQLAQLAGIDPAQFACAQKYMACHGFVSFNQQSHINQHPPRWIRAGPSQNTHRSTVPTASKRNGTSSRSWMDVTVNRTPCING